MAAGGYYVREYAAILEAIINGSWFTYENFAEHYRLAEQNYAALTQPGKGFYNAQGLWLSFDLERTSDFSEFQNISIAEYLEAKLATLRFYLAQLDKYAEGNPQIPARFYIRCDKSNWQNVDQYAMEASDGVVTIHIRVADQMRLKVYDDQTGTWYGAECVAESCAVAFDSDHHTNIVLQEGTYRITFDPVTGVITLEEASC